MTDSDVTTATCWDTKFATSDIRNHFDGAVEWCCATVTLREIGEAARWSVYEAVPELGSWSADFFEVLA